MSNFVPRCQFRDNKMYPTDFTSSLKIAYVRKIESLAYAVIRSVETVAVLHVNSWCMLLLLYLKFTFSLQTDTKHRHWRKGRACQVMGHWIENSSTFIDLEALLKLELAEFALYNRMSSGWGLTLRFYSSLFHLGVKLYIVWHTWFSLMTSKKVKELPPKAEVVARSNKTSIEIFRYGNHIMGIQGHPEYTEDILLHLIDRLLQRSFIMVYIKITYAAQQRKNGPIIECGWFIYLLSDWWTFRNHMLKNWRPVSGRASRTERPGGGSASAFLRVDYDHNSTTNQSIGKGKTMKREKWSVNTGCWYELKGRKKTDIRRSISEVREQYATENQIFWFH